MADSPISGKFRTLFLSDMHLGYWVSRGTEALAVLEQIDVDRIYLVGDIVDESRMQRQWYWPVGHQQVIEKLLSLRTDQKEVFATPGNHDTYLRRQEPLSTCDQDSEFFKLLESMLKIERAESFDYVLSGGEKLLVTHGDLYDDLDASLIGIPKLGSRIFDRINWLLPRAIVNQLRWFFKLVLAKPQKIEERLIQVAKEQGYDGVIFGHLHEPKLYQQNGFIVANCGDWMTNRSFLVETIEGELELYNFGKRIAVSELP